MLRGRNYSMVEHAETHKPYLTIDSQPVRPQNQPPYPQVDLKLPKIVNSQLEKYNMQDNELTQDSAGPFRTKSPKHKSRIYSNRTVTNSRNQSNVNSSKSSFEEYVAGHKIKGTVVPVIDKAIIEANLAVLEPTVEQQKLNMMKENQIRIENAISAENRKKQQ